MSTTFSKFIFVLAVCGGSLWKLGSGWFGPVVEPGKVTILTTDNFYEARRNSDTLIAIYMGPG